MKDNNEVEGIVDVIPELDIFENTVKQAFLAMKISYSNKYIFYKRNDHEYSQLGIQVGNDSNNLDDYILFIKDNGTISMHISGNISQDGNMIVNLLGTNIYTFFENVEHNYINELVDFKVDVRRNMSPTLKKETIATRIRRFFK